MSLVVGAGQVWGLIFPSSAHGHTVLFPGAQPACSVTGPALTAADEAPPFHHRQVSTRLT